MENRINDIGERMKVLDDESDKRDLSEMEMEKLKRLNIKLGEAIKLKESI